MKPKGWWKDGDFNQAKAKQKLGFILSASHQGVRVVIFQLSNVFFSPIFSGKTEVDGKCVLYRLCQSIRRCGAGGSKQRWKIAWKQRRRLLSLLFLHLSHLQTVKNNQISQFDLPHPPWEGALSSSAGSEGAAPWYALIATIIPL